MVVLEGAPVDPPAHDGGDSPAREPDEAQTAGSRVGERPQDPVTSGDVVYDRALLPPGFFDRGVSEADQAWWEVRFLSSVLEKDQPLVQALVQGEIDRVGDYVGAMGEELKAMEPREASRARHSMLRQADRAGDLLRHVQLQVERFRRR